MLACYFALTGSQYMLVSLGTTILRGHQNTLKCSDSVVGCAAFRFDGKHSLTARDDLNFSLLIHTRQVFLTMQDSNYSTVGRLHKDGRIDQMLNLPRRAINASHRQYSDPQNGPCYHPHISRMTGQIPSA